MRFGSLKKRTKEACVSLPPCEDSERRSSVRSKSSLDRICRHRDLGLPSPQNSEK